MIKDLPITELLAGLAEECCELGQAALKYRRAVDGTNPTQVTIYEAIDGLEEEIADVMLYLDYIRYSQTKVNAIMSKKRQRWEERLARHA